MSRNWTILLVLLAVGAVTFLAIWEPLTHSTREQRDALRDGRVLRFDPREIRKVRIIAAGEEIELERQGDGWDLGPKSKDRADAALVRQLLGTAASMEFFDRIDAREFRDDDDWGEFGLRNPKRRIVFECDRTVTLFIGKDGADESRVYVRPDTGRDVFLVDDALLKDAFRDRGEFRDRILTNWKPSQVDRFSVRRGGGEIEVVQDARGWRITKPLNAAADEKSVVAFLTKVLGVRINSFAVEDSGDLGAFGIAEGENEIALFVEGGKRPQILRLGTRDGGVFGQFTARDSIYSLPAGTMGLLAVNPSSLRDRRLLPVNVDTVDLIRLRLPGGTISLRRSDGGWEAETAAGKRPGSAAAVQALVDALTTTRVTAYDPVSNARDLAAAGIAADSLKVEFIAVLSENTPEMRAGENVVSTITFGSAKDGLVSAQVDELPEILMVPESVLTAIPADPSAWAAPK